MSLSKNDEVRFLSHMIAALNSKNKLVRAMTRDRLFNEMPKIHGKSQKSLTDSHRFMHCIWKYGADLWHKPGKKGEAKISK